MDDSRGMRMIVRRFAQEFGLEVTEAGNGTEGLDRLDEMDVPAPELIVVDWKMPTMDGFDFVRVVRSTPFYDDTFILLLTSESGSDEIRQALQQGVNDYLIKPCTGKDIREKLESVIRQINFHMTPSGS
jgi:two-component system chemotaxis response regulator CheY